MDHLLPLQRLGSGLTAVASRRQRFEEEREIEAGPDLYAVEDQPTEEEARMQEIEATFSPWHQQPKEIARLLRFLELLDETPVEIPAFIEHAEDYRERYELMLGCLDRDGKIKAGTTVRFNRVPRK